MAKLNPKQKLPTKVKIEGEWLKCNATYKIGSKYFFGTGKSNKMKAETEIEEFFY